ncbi:adenine methyltransferase, partial [Enterococcus hirae]|nr:adenine methyltransferase [Enterococcus hirae]
LNFSQGINKTNFSSILNDDDDDDSVPVYGGKDVHQFKITNKPSIFMKIENAEKRSKNMYKDFRIAYRDVARATDKRTVIATLLPEKSVVVNSMNVQSEDNTTLKEKLFYLGIMNSYIYDFLLRNVIDKHVSISFVKQTPMPIINEFKYTNELIQISKTLLQKNNDEMYVRLNSVIKDDSFFSKMSIDELIAELNARIFIDFELSREEIIALMKTFEGKKSKQAVQEEAQRIIEVYDRLKAGEE